MDVRCVIQCLLYMALLSADAMRNTPIVMASISIQDTTPTTLSVKDRWTKTEKKILEFSSKLFQTFLPQINDSIRDLGVSDKCLSSIHRLMSGIRTIEPWAFSMLDASGFSMDGMLIGRLSVMGDYNQCLDIVFPTEHGRENETAPVIRGKYCSIDIIPYLPPKSKSFRMNRIMPELKNISLQYTTYGDVANISSVFYTFTHRFGVCFPSTCTPEDVTEIISLVKKEFLFNVTLRGCRTKETSTEFTAIHIVIISAFSLIVLLTTVATGVDVFRRKVPPLSKKLSKIVSAFSLFARFKEFIDIGKPPDMLSSINGLRFLTMAWIILFHSNVAIDFYGFRAVYVIKAYVNSIFYQSLINASVSVDTFFLIGGLLLCYNTVSKIRSNNFSISLHFLRRYLRLTPGLMAVVGAIFLQQFLKSGPLWIDCIAYVEKKCRKRWWTNFLYINNFFHPNDMCLVHTWYLSCDFQLYIVCTLVLMVIARWTKAGLILNGAIIVACCFARGLRTYILNLPPTALFGVNDKQQLESYFHSVYCLPHAHYGPYGIGLYVGYILATKKRLSLGPVAQLIGWGATGCNVFVLFGSYAWTAETDPSLLETSLYAALNRTVWSIGLGWVILACAFGYGGPIDRVLSLRIWVPLGRLTFMAYLVHPILQMTLSSHMLSSITASQIVLLWIYLGHLVASYGVALVLYLVVESPFVSLQKSFLKTKDMKRIKTSSN